MYRVALDVAHRREHEEHGRRDEGDRRQAERVLADDAEDEQDRRADGGQAPRRQYRWAQPAPDDLEARLWSAPVVAVRSRPCAVVGAHGRSRRGRSPPARYTRPAPSTAKRTPTITPIASGPPPRASVVATIATPSSASRAPRRRVDCL